MAVCRDFLEPTRDLVEGGPNACIMRWCEEPRTPNVLAPYNCQYEGKSPVPRLLSLVSSSTCFLGFLTCVWLSSALLWRSLPRNRSYKIQSRISAGVISTKPASSIPSSTSMEGLNTLAPRLAVKACRSEVSDIVHLAECQLTLADTWLLWGDLDQLSTGLPPFYSNLTKVTQPIKTSSISTFRCVGT